MLQSLQPAFTFLLFVSCCWSNVHHLCRLKTDFLKANEHVNKYICYNIYIIMYLYGGTVSSRMINTNSGMGYNILLLYSLVVNYGILLVERVLEIAYFLFEEYE